jgi:hypothetical protein
MAVAGVLWHDKYSWEAALDHDHIAHVTADLDFEEETKDVPTITC